MKRPGYNATLDFAHETVHRSVDLWALARHVGGDHLSPFHPYALSTTFKGILRVAGLSVTVVDPMAFAAWLRAECRPSRPYRDRNRKQLQYAAKAWEHAALCWAVSVALAESAAAIVADVVSVARDWLTTCTAEERAALLAVARLNYDGALRDFMGPAFQSLRRRAEDLTRGKTPRSGAAP